MKAVILAGGVVPWLPPEDFGKYSRTRNRLIASLLMRTQQAEKMGTGIRRIQQALQAAGKPLAEFDYDDYNFSITLFSNLRTEQGGTLNGTLNEKIYEMIRYQPGIQRKELIEQIGAAVRTVARGVSELLSDGKIEHRGSKKTGG